MGLKGQLKPQVRAGLIGYKRSFPLTGYVPALPATQYQSIHDSAGREGEDCFFTNGAESR